MLGGGSYPVCSTQANLNQRRELTLRRKRASVALIGNMDLHTSIGKQTLPRAEALRAP